MQRVCALWGAAVVLLSSPGVAAGKLYLGASAGESRIELQAQGGEFEIEETAYKGYLGLQLASFLALEASYADFGDLRATSDGVQLDGETRAAALFAVVGLRLSPRFELFGKGGAARWESEVTAADGQSSTVDEQEGEDFAYGFGAVLDLSRRVGLRGEWESYELEGRQDVRLVSAGLRIRF